MCGITGLWDLGGTIAPEALTREVAAMTAALSHRGPDSGAVWVDAEAGLGLGHRRLAIVDLSPTGAQPMASADGRFVISYNGEVYSHEDIRPSLAARGVAIRGHSDTEVMLESIAAFGIAATLPRLIGMFAMAVWDRRERTAGARRRDRSTPEGHGGAAGRGQARRRQARRRQAR